ncbi:hypothetical protein ACJX0J_039668, partial [Zea mays]
ELYHELHALDRLEHDYRLKQKEQDGLSLREYGSYPKDAEDEEDSSANVKGKDAVSEGDDGKAASEDFVGLNVVMSSIEDVLSVLLEKDQKTKSRKRKDFIHIVDPQKSKAQAVKEVVVKSSPARAVKIEVPRVEDAEDEEDSSANVKGKVAVTEDDDGKAASEDFVSLNVVMSRFGEELADVASEVTSPLSLVSMHVRAATIIGAKYIPNAAALLEKDRKTKSRKRKDVIRIMDPQKSKAQAMKEVVVKSSPATAVKIEMPRVEVQQPLQNSPFALPPRINVPAPRSRIEALDLNSQSQGTDFPYLSSYQDVLQSGDGGSDLGLPPLGRCRSARTLFQSTRSILAPISHARGAIPGCCGVRGRGTSSRGGGQSAISAPIDPVLIEDFGDEPTNEMDSRALV